MWHFYDFFLFIYLRDIAKTTFDARAFRFLVVTSQYRSPLNFSPETFKSALQSLKRIDKIALKLQTIIAKTSSNNANNNNDSNNVNVNANVKETCDTILLNFEKAMSDDMNTPRATAELFALVTCAEKLLNNADSEVIINETTSNNVYSLELTQSVHEIWRCMLRMDEVFGIFYDINDNSNSNTSSNKETNKVVDVVIPDEVAVLAEKRAQAKQNKLYAEADQYRAQISELGYTVKDIKNGGFEIIKN